MATNVPIPSLGDSISQVTVLRWIKNDGDYVQVDEAFVELETDKANTELQAQVAGVLHPSRKVGDTIKVGEIVAVIDEKATASTTAPAADLKTSAAAQVQASPSPSPAPPAASKPQEPSPSAMDDLNPSVRPLLIEHRLNPSDIPGTGPHGRLLKEDVLRYLEQKNGNGKAASNPAAAPAASMPVATPVPAAPPVSPISPSPAKSSAPSPAPASGIKSAGADTPAAADYSAAGEARVPMSKIRKRTALNLKQAQNTAAILTTFNEVDMSAIMDLRARLKERFEKTHGIGLGFMSFFAKAVILGLREFPKINAYIDGDDTIYHNYVNLGVAVSSERGLAVPVLKHAEQMSFAKIESEIKRLATAVRENKLSLPELTGGTFTITNGGVFGSLLSTPILNPPQSGILGMHAINKRPVAINDKVEIRPMMYVALSYDHRIVDGRDSVSFLVRLKEYLEDPARLMLEI
ncbi:MAG TPA: 2-oxoglutarate dehydrogenase complex dihydrolipoyllysine-residue succinyltransferase [Tepidisphaeraceae bacterium]|jgi:2-oxoglutarate dehydrogenase E2 component (dihydrolipoamide succinyltransferase)|nr:2-oxoglutarate dehydrogenase complex dihydrolipoyllysine-residue succinyltransferase [Tepidisphaeraceae bacterium]